MKKVPFFSNTDDNTHCFQAMLRMILKYFLPEKDFSFAELDKFSGKVKGKWTWSSRALINLQKMGFELVNICCFDWQKFIRVVAK